MCLISREVGVFPAPRESYFIERAHKIELFLSRIWEAVKKLFENYVHYFFSKKECPSGLSPDKLALAEKDILVTFPKSFLQGSKTFLINRRLDRKKLEGLKIPGGAEKFKPGNAGVKLADLRKLKKIVMRLREVYGAPTQAKGDSSTKIGIGPNPDSLNVRTLYLMSATASLWNLIASGKALTKDSALELIDTACKEADETFFKLPLNTRLDAGKDNPSITSSIIIELGKEKFFSGMYKLFPKKEHFYSKQEFLKKLLCLAATTKEDIAAIILDVNDERGNFFGFSEAILIDTRKKTAVFYTLFQKRGVELLEFEELIVDIPRIRRTENIEEASYLMSEAMEAVLPGHFSVIKKLKDMNENNRSTY